MFAVWTAILGTIIPLIVGWCLSMGPVVDRGAVLYWLIGEPAVSVAVAALILLCRVWLRKRIEPNRDYPLPPKLPPGGATPLIMDQSTGQLVDAGGPRLTDLHATGEWIDFQIGRHQLPDVCCTCLGVPAPRSSIWQTVFRTALIVVPLCSRCAREWKVRMWLLGVTASAIVVASAFLMLLALVRDELTFWILFVLVCGVGPLFCALAAYRLTSPVRVKCVDFSRALVRLRFRNADYRSRVLQMAGAHD